MIDWPILSAMLVGHLCLAVLAVNVLHGIGIPEGMPTRVVKGLCIALVASVSIAMMDLIMVLPWGGWPRAARAYALLCVLVGGIGLPSITLSRSRRRLPEGVSGRSREVELTDAIPRAELIGTGWDAAWLRLPGNQATRLALTDWQVERPGLPGPLDGLRILHLTDLHLTPAYSDRFFEAMVAQAESFEADLVAFTGDLIDDAALLDRVGPLLGRFRGRFGKLAILGNHDYRTSPGGATEALRAAGFEVIEGSWTRIDLDGVRLAVGGTSSPWGPLPDPSAMPEADLRLLLSHSPDPIGWAATQGIDLMLAGHTHGGQYRLPVIGPVLMPSRYSRRYDRGFFRRGPTLLYVSLGIAAQHPMRINCPAEVSRFTMRATRTASPHASRPARATNSLSLSMSSRGRPGQM